MSTKDLDIDKIISDIMARVKRAVDTGDTSGLGRFMGLQIGGIFLREAFKILLEVYEAIGNGVISFKPITYSPTSPKSNKPIDLTGMLILPEAGKKGNIPILCYQHGTEIYRPYSPSKFKLLKLPFNFYEFFLAAMFAIRGRYAVLMPDYPGMGGAPVNMVQPFMVVEPLVRSVVDMLEYVVNNVVTEKKGEQDCFLWNKQIFLAGYSEGGFVTMAVARKLKQDKGRYTVTACAPMAGPHELYQIQMKKKFLTREKIKAGHLLTMIIRGYHEGYKDKPEISGALTREAMRFIPEENIHCERLWDWADGNHKAEELDESKEMQDPQCDQLSDATQKMLDDVKSPVAGVMIENNTYKGWPVEIKDERVSHINLFHAEDDEVVPIENSKVAHKTLSTLGYDIKVTPISPLTGPGPETIHARAGIPAMYKAIEYFEPFIKK